MKINVTYRSSATAIHVFVGPDLCLDFVWSGLGLDLAATSLGCKFELFSVWQWRHHERAVSASDTATITSILAKIRRRR
jgi:hypothetical protein